MRLNRLKTLLLSFTLLIVVACQQDRQGSPMALPKTATTAVPTDSSASDPDQIPDLEDIKNSLQESQILTPFVLNYLESMNSEIKQTGRFSRDGFDENSIPQAALESLFKEDVFQKYSTVKSVISASGSCENSEDMCFSAEAIQKSENKSSLSLRLTAASLGWLVRKMGLKDESLAQALEKFVFENLKPNSLKTLHEKMSHLNGAVNPTFFSSVASEIQMILKVPEADFQWENVCFRISAVKDSLLNLQTPRAGILLNLFRDSTLKKTDQLMSAGAWLMDYCEQNDTASSPSVFHDREKMNAQMTRIYQSILSVWPEMKINYAIIEGRPPRMNSDFDELGNPTDPGL